MQEPPKAKLKGAELLHRDNKTKSCSTIDPYQGGAADLI